MTVPSSESAAPFPYCNNFNTNRAGAPAPARFLFTQRVYSAFFGSKNLCLSIRQRRGGYHPPAFLSSAEALRTIENTQKTKAFGRLIAAPTVETYLKTTNNIFYAQCIPALPCVNITLKRRPNLCCAHTPLIGQKPKYLFAHIVRCVPQALPGKLRLVRLIKL